MLAADGLVGVGGLGEIDGETAAWFLFTDRITPGRFVSVYRALAHHLAKVLADGGSVFIHVNPDYPEALRLAQRLGFRGTQTETVHGGRIMIRMVADARVS